MRISTNQFFQRGTDAILDQQALLNRTQMQLSTGKKIISPSDDPSGSVRVLELQHSIDLAGTYQRNISSAETALSSEENALSNINDILQRVRELAIQGNGGVLDNVSLQGIAQEVQQHLSGLLDLANTVDSNGEYLFSGYSTTIKPFSQTPAGFSYDGDQGQRYIQIGANRQVAINDPGYTVFETVRNGNGTFVADYGAGNTGTGIIDPGKVTDPTAWVSDTYTVSFITATSYEVRDSASNLVTSGTYESNAAISFNGIQTAISGDPAIGDTFTISPSTNQDIFTTVKNLLTALSTSVADPISRAKVTGDINRAIVDIDQAMDRMINMRASIGARLNSIDNQKEVNADLVGASQVALSAVQDLDYAEAISRLNQQMISLQAAQQSFTKIQGLTLFNFI